MSVLPICRRESTRARASTARKAMRWSKMGFGRTGGSSVSLRGGGPEAGFPLRGPFLGAMTRQNSMQLAGSGNARPGIVVEWCPKIDQEETPVKDKTMNRDELLRERIQHIDITRID